MADNVSVHPSRQIRFVRSFEDQEQETIRYWKTQNFSAKMLAVQELNEYWARMHGVDVDAEGPKRTTRVVPRVRS